MSYTLFIIAIVLLMFAAERIIVLTMTRRPACQSFIRQHWCLTPNGISILRIPQGLIAIAIAAAGNWDLAILWFSFWMITDLSDGTIARNCNLETPAGAWLDPLSDKCMSFPALFYLSLGSSPNVVSPKLPIVWVIVYCIIDVAGQSSRLFCAKKSANLFGKVKTALVTVLIALLGLNQLRLPPLTFFNEQFVYVMMVSCVLLAALSLYCKVVPSSWYANSLTFLNLCCGILAIYTAWSPHIHNNFVLAFVLIFMGQFFDLFDGRMARKYGSTRFGALFDDIADFTSFGLAVGSVIYCALTYDDGRVNQFFAILVTVCYIVCLFYRLYRFLKPTVALPGGIFQGMPSPAGALLAGSCALIADLFTNTKASYIAAAVIILASLLMISNIKYRHFGQDLWPSLPKQLRAALLIIAIVFVCIALVSQDYAKVFTGFLAFLSVIYAFGARASRSYVDALFAAQAAATQNSNSQTK